MGKMPSAILLSVIVLIVELGICCLARNSTFECIEGERKALLRFKTSLEDPSNRLSSWNWKNKDCCAWQGVKCNKITGHVIKLDLNNKRYDGMLQGERIDSSLLELKYLRYLDLSRNNFNGSKIPAFLGSMKQLQHLNLSTSDFSGIVPHHLGNLSRLRALDLGGNYQRRLIVDDLMWAVNLSSLEYLDMSYVNLSSTKDIVQVLQMLPSLVELRLSDCELDNTHLSHAFINSTTLSNIQYLDLSYNTIEGELPCFLPNMTSLRFLDLSDNMFNFSLIHLLPLKNLVNLNLGFNTFHQNTDWISDFMSDRCLKSLNLEGNDFYGDISGFFKNLSRCLSHNMESLTLGYNNFYGHLPTSLGKLSALRALSLSGNQLSGEIPISLGQLSKLERLDISYNSFKSFLSEAHFANLSKLEYLGADSTMSKFGYDWVPSFQLKHLTMGSSKIGGQFPEWLQAQKALIDLDLSNCSITGTLPKWLRSMNSLAYLYLSHNNIKGPLPELASSMITLDLSYNMITHLPSNISHMMPRLGNLLLARNFINGSIPNSLCNLKALIELDLSKNHLSGNLPDCWQNLQNLEVVRMSSNQLSGVMPNSIGGSYFLSVLHLNDNNLVGQLPLTLRNCTNLRILDIGGNSLSGKLPEWIGNDLLHLQVLRLRDNKFYGTTPPAFCELSYLQVLDLANNMLIGNIPHCFGNFSSMTSGSIFDEWFPDESLSQVIKGVELEYTTTVPIVINLDLSSNYLVGEIPSELTGLSGLLGLNLSNNYLGGEIPTRIGDLKSLESLDLSNNNLFGTIPDSLSNLSFLSHLNLSYNNLSGQIPTGRQLQTLDDPSIYDGNPHLCGAPLLKKCLNGKALRGPNVENHVADEGDKAVKIYFYAVIVAGFAMGFWGLIGVLVVKTKWRQVYFELIEAVMDKMLGC